MPPLSRRPRPPAVTRAEFARLQQRVEQCCHADAVHIARMAQLQALLDRALAKLARPHVPRT